MSHCNSAFPFAHSYNSRFKLLDNTITFKEAHKFTVPVLHFLRFISHNSVKAKLPARVPAADF